MIIDGGDCDIGVESTIVKLEENGEAILLRPGKITVTELAEVLGEIRIAKAVTAALKEGETVYSPGMKYRHYAPRCSVVLLKGDEKSRQKYISEHSGSVAVFSYSEYLRDYKALSPSLAVYDFGSESEPTEQAKRLFYLLREADKVGYDCIYAPLPDTDGVSLALYNRMIRAAAYTVVEV